MWIYQHCASDIALATLDAVQLVQVQRLLHKNMFGPYCCKQTWQICKGWGGGGGGGGGGGEEAPASYITHAEYVCVPNQE